MAFCANCGKEISDVAVACPNCGHPGPGASRAPGIPTSSPVPQPTVGVPYAGWWQRVAATIIDGIIVGVPSGILVAILGGDGSRTVNQIDPFTGQVVEGTGYQVSGWGFAIVSLIGIAYRVFFEGGRRGQTLGKMAMKTAVRDVASGGPIGYGRALVRWLVATVLWFFFFIPGLIDVLFPLWDPKHQSIHDKAASSIVVQVTP